MRNAVGIKSKVIKNGLYSTIGLVVTTLLSFATRRVFAHCLGAEFLGYNGLFSNIFSFLSISDLGISTAIVFLLYKEYSNDNWEEISRLLQIYKSFYRIVAITSVVLGIVISFFLKYIISENSSDWDYVTKLYYIQLLSTIASYFLIYKRTLFLVAQKQYKYVAVDTAFKMLMNAAQMVVLIIWKSYIGYLLCVLVYNIATNIIVALIFPRNFPNVRKCKISLRYIRKDGLISNMKAGIVNNIAGIVYGATDTIIISKMLGIEMAGLYSNYIMVVNGIQLFINSILSGLGPAVGNIVYQRDYSEVECLYRNLNVMYYIIALSVSAGFLCLFQPFVSLWLGSTFLIPFPVVIAIVINQYIAWNHGNIFNFRNSWGDYNTDKLFYVASAVCNIIVSVLLCLWIGLIGVVIGTIIGHLFIWAGRVYVVHRYIIKGDLKRYFVNEIVKILFAFVSLCPLYLVSLNAGDGIVGMMISVLMILVYICFVSAVICSGTTDGRFFLRYMRNVLLERKPKMHS